MRTLKLAILGLLMLAAPAIAAPVSVVANQIGQTWTLDYNGIVDVNGVPTVLPGLSTSVSYEVVDLFYDAASNATGLVLDVSIFNSTDATLFSRAAVDGLGFDADPNVIRAWSSASGYYNRLAYNTTLPTGAGFQIEVCMSTRSSSCAGVRRPGNQIGTTQSSQVFLAFRGDLTGIGVTLDNFGVRYGDLYSTAYGLNGALGMGVPTAPIPEPASMAVFGLGALLVGAALRRKRD